MRDYRDLCDACESEKQDCACVLPPWRDAGDEVGRTPLATTTGGGDSWQVPPPLAFGPADVLLAAYGGLFSRILR